MRRPATAALGVALLVAIAASEARAGIRLGVIVANVEAIPGAHVVSAEPAEPGGSILKLKSGDLIRYVRVDDAVPLWRTPDALSLVTALRQAKKVVVYYYRGGAWHKGTVRVVDSPDGGEPKFEGDEGKPCDDPREGAEETDVPGVPKD